MKNVFIVWTNYQARVEGIISDLNKKLGPFKVIYRKNPPKKRVIKLINYLSYIIKDFFTILGGSYTCVFVQVPPSYALVAPLIVKKFCNKKIKIVADCHNAMMRSLWLNRFGSKFLLKNVDHLILHNEIIYEEGLKILSFIPREKVLLLEDKTLNYKNPGKIQNLSHPAVFVPLSFNLDEPVNEVFKAAAMMPSIHFILTGNPAKLRKNFSVNLDLLPNNIILTGWLSKSDYNFNLINCDVVLGLTIFDDVQMSVSNEALGAENVMVLSDKSALRKIYKNAAIYTSNNSKSISKAILNALQKKEEIKKNIIDVKRLKMKRYQCQINNITKKIKKGE